MFGHLGVEGHFGEERAVAGVDGGGEGVEEGPAGSGGELRGLGGEVFGRFAHFLAGEPFAVAALIPVGEVLRGDKITAVVFFDKGDNLGEFIEPGEDYMGGFAVAEALVEFFAKGFGESGDFAGAVHRLSEGGGLRMADGFIGDGMNGQRMEGAAGTEGDLKNIQQPTSNAQHPMTEEARGYEGVW